MDHQYNIKIKAWCHHEKDLDVKTEKCVFASHHGKGVCGGMGDTI